MVQLDILFILGNTSFSTQIIRFVGIDLNNSIITSSSSSGDSLSNYLCNFLLIYVEECFVMWLGLW